MSKPVYSVFSSFLFTKGVRNKTQIHLFCGHLVITVHSPGRTAEFYHYFCCLFSTDGVQAGKDEEGLNGFLLQDLKQELKRGASLKCDFCKKTGATIKCRR